MDGPHSVASSAGEVAARSNSAGRLSAGELIALVRDTQDRSAYYQFGPIMATLGEGRAPRLTRRGLRIFYLHRAAYRTPIDWRAAEAVSAEHEAPAPAAVPPTQTSTTRAVDAGMTLSEFAAWARVTRTGIGKHVVEVAPGELPTVLPVGAIPVRRVGVTRRVFKSDFLGHAAQGEPPKSTGAPNAGDQEATPGSARRSAWDRSIADLRDRFSRGK